MSRRRITGDEFRVMLVHSIQTTIDLGCQFGGLIHAAREDWGIGEESNFLRAD
jgi:hypothetical protein